MSEAVTLAILGFMQAVTLGALALLSKRTNKVAKNSEETHAQIVNHHPNTPNYRVENDSRYNETMEWFATLSSKIDSQGIRLTRAVKRLDKIEDEMEPSYVSRRR